MKSFGKIPLARAHQLLPHHLQLQSLPANHLMSVSRAKLGYISLISHCTCRYTAPPLADVGQRRHFGRSRICGASPAPLRSIIDLFVGAPPKQESGHPQLPSPTDEDKQTAKATNASTRPRASSQGPYSSGRSGIFGNLLKKPRIARGDSGEADLLRAKNDEMSKALERMLRGGGRGTLATGNTGMDVRCTTLDQRGKSDDSKTSRSRTCLSAEVAIVSQGRSRRLLANSANWSSAVAMGSSPGICAS